MQLPRAASFPSRSYQLIQRCRLRLADTRLSVQFKRLPVMGHQHGADADRLAWPVLKQVVHRDGSCRATSTSCRPRPADSRCASRPCAMISVPHGRRCDWAISFSVVRKDQIDAAAVNVEDLGPDAPPTWPSIRYASRAGRGPMGCPSPGCVVRRRLPEHEVHRVLLVRRDRRPGRHPPCSSRSNGGRGCRTPASEGTSNRAHDRPPA